MRPRGGKGGGGNALNSIGLALQATCNLEILESGLGLVAISAFLIELQKYSIDFSMAGLPKGRVGSSVLADDNRRACLGYGV